MEPARNATTTPSARSLVLDLLSTLRRGAMPVRALVEAAALFGIAENSVRVALSRLSTAGLVESDERGRYRMGSAAAALRGRVASWRRLDERVVEWSGGWLAVMPAGGGTARADRRRSERALRWMGFRELRRGLSVRPDNLAGGVDAARRELRELGLASGALVCELHALDEWSEARARSLWDVEGRAAAYRALRRDIEDSARRLRQMPESEAMVESFLRGGPVLRQLALDPRLPESIEPGAERRALIDTMRDYDALGRECWSRFLARHDVPHRAAPVDTRAAAPGGLR